MDYDIALVAYAPNGARIGNLPQPLSINVSSTLNDLGSLIFSYPAASAASETLASPVEVAVEVLNASGKWVEPPNMRFMNLSWSKNRNDETETVTYTCPGYAWQLNKAVTYPPDASVKVDAIENATEESKVAAAAYKAASNSLRTAVGVTDQGSIVLSGHQPTVVNNGVWVKTDTTPVPHKGYIKDTTRTWTAVTSTAAMNAAKAVVTTKADADAAESKVTRIKDDKSIARVFAGASAGTLVGTFLSEAQTRGALPGVTFSFGSAKDSSGRNWARVIPQYELSAGAPLFPVLDTLSSQGLCDWRTTGRKLELYNPDTTLAANRASTVNLIYGLDISDAPDKGTLTEMVGSLLFVGDEGLNFEMKNVSAPDPWGVWEGSISQGGVTNEASGRIFGQTALNAGSSERVESTRELMLDRSEQLPFIHYGVGDFILAPGPKGSQDEMRVRQITLTRDGAGNVTGNVVLNDRFVERSIREAKRISGIFGGSGSGGTGTPVKPSPGADRRYPRPASELQVMPDVYISDEGAIVGIVQAAWFHDGMATDQTLIDIEKHVLEYAEVNAAGYIDGGWKVGSESEHPYNSVGLDGLRPKRADGSASEYQFRVRTTAYNGKQSLSDRVQVTMVADVEPPPVPQFLANDVTTWLRTITVRWNGKGVNGTFAVDMPRDFSHVNVYQAALASGPWTLVGSIGAKHELWQSDIMPTVVTWYALSAVDRSGNESARSTARSIKPSANVDMTEIIQKIDAGKVLIENAGKVMLESGKELSEKLADSDKSIADAGTRLTALTSRVGPIELGMDVLNKTTIPNLTKSIDGKTTINRQTTVAASPASYSLGDRWERWDKLTVGGKLMQTWRHNGTAWIEEILSATYLPLVDIGAGTFGSLDGGRLTANSVSTQSLLVGSFSNLLENGGFEFGSKGWGTVAGWSFEDAGGRLAPGALKVTGITERTFGPTSSINIPVEAGDSYRVSGWVRTTAPASASTQGEICLYYYDGNGAFLSNKNFNIGDATSAWKPYSTLIKPPETAAYFRVRLNATMSSASHQYFFDDIAVVKASDGSLIVNGSITGTHIDAKSVAAEVGTFLKLDVVDLIATGTAKINQAVITKLFTETFTTHKLTAGQVLIGMPGNILPDIGHNDPLMLARRNAASTMEVGLTNTNDYALIPNATSATYFRPLGVKQDATNYVDWVPVKPGQVWRFGMDVVSMRTEGWMKFVGRTVDGQAYMNPPGSTIIKVGNGSYQYEAKIPEGCAWICPELMLPAGTATTWIDQGSMFLHQVIDNALIVDGAVTAKKLTVTEEMWASIINFKKIRGDQIEANTITADQINAGSLRTAILTANSIKSTMIDADAINAKHTITGATFQTSSAANTGIKFSYELGLRAYDVNGATTLEVNTNGNATFNGIVTAKSDDHQVRVMPSVYDSKPGIQFDTGTYHSTQPYIVAHATSASDPYSGTLRLSSAGHSGERSTQLRLNAGSTWQLGSDVGTPAADRTSIFGYHGTIDISAGNAGSSLTVYRGGVSMGAGVGGVKFIHVREDEGIRLQAPDINSSGTFVHLGSMRIRGTFSVESSKNFVMPHPNREGMELYHASTESPVSGVEYWGTGAIPKSGEAIVRLPHYFEDLTKARNRATLVTSQGAPVTWSAISDNSFTVTGEPGTQFSWLVKAERFGGDFDVEAWAVPPTEEPAPYIPSNPSEESA